VEAPAAFQPPAHRVGKENVILIVVDTLRRDRLGSYEYARATTPRLDELASQSARYTQATAQAPWTLPSIGATLTSQLPSWLEVEDTRRALPDEAVLLSEVLQDAGYSTGAVVSHSFCSSQWAFDQGFDSFDESNVLGHDAVTSEGVTDRAIDFVNSQEDGPFFLWVHYFDPHFSYIRHDQFPWATDDDYDGWVKDGMKITALRNKARKGLTEADLDEINRIYDSEVAYTDQQIGRLLDHLRQQELYQDAMIVFTHDHGEEFMDHDRFGHTTTLWAEVVGAPLLVKYPGGTGEVANNPVGLVDIYPTVLEVLGLPGQEGIAGHSLLQAPDPKRPVYTETKKGSWRRSVRVGNLKLIMDMKKGNKQLFDVVKDPTEQRDLSGRKKREADVARLSRLIKHWPKPSKQIAPGKNVDLENDEIAELEALGYVVDAPE